MNDVPAIDAQARPPRGAVAGPLNGLRVLELGHFIAAPFAARLLADLGAEVIKVEPPVSGDPARGWGAAIQGKSLWWSVHARNKKCVTLDLKHPRGLELALRLIGKSDAVLENFRPGQLEKWGIGRERLRNANPRCILIRISGFGQTGPYRDRVAFGVIGEAIGGIRYLTAYPKAVSTLPPVRTGVSLADSVAAIYAVVGLLAALYQRDHGREVGGCEVDVALYEAIFSLLEGCLPEYGRLGRIREPSGATLPTTAPTNTYLCRDGAWICIAGNSDRIFSRLMALIGHPELLTDPRFKTNRDRVANSAELDRIIGAWTAGLPAREAEALLERAEVPASRIYTIKDCVEDAHFRARGMIQTVMDPQFGELLHPGVVPRFDAGSDGHVGWPGPPLGAHNSEVYRDVAGLDAAEIAALRREGVI